MSTGGLEEGTSNNGNVYVEGWDEMVNNFVESLIILKITLEVINTIIRLFNTIRIKERNSGNEEFYSFNSIKGVERSHSN